MGKRQHQGDKMYITGKEWSELFGGHKRSIDKAQFRRLPFTCCSISMTPFENPMCTKEGHMFDLLNIVPWLKKYGTNPITGKKLDAKGLIKLKFYKTSDTKKFHCPVLFKIFNENTHIVANGKTGNVYCYEAIEQLNMKSKNWRDLLTDEPYTREDLITIQDPKNLDKFNLQTFHHLKHNIKLPDADPTVRSHPRYFLKATNAETSQTLDQLDRDYKGDQILRDANPTPSTSGRKLDKFNTAHYTTGRVAASFTSTVMERQLNQEIALKDEDEVRYKYVTDKGYVRIQTNMGDLNIELYCPEAPKTCENFIKLCQKGYYNNTLFHRSIKNFMIQGGDPTGTGTGGDSIWGGSFKDEIVMKFSHTGRGVLSMANSGKDTNKSQFFITYRSCKHLDRKHSIFGHVVGGMDTLNKMEAIKTDKLSDKPLSNIKLISATVFVNPFEAADNKLKELREEEEQKLIDEEKEREKEKKRNKKEKLKVYQSGVGKYINTSSIKTKEDDTEPIVKKSKIVSKSSQQFKNFSSW